MNGQMQVQSTPGEGSQFRFTAVFEKCDNPAAPEVSDSLESSAAGKRSTACADSSNRIRILLAEDEPTNQLVTRTVLQKSGYQVDVVSNGSEALKALAEQDYALVLMDCMMPVMNGYEATALIRDPASPVRNHAVPIIALTANVMKEDHDLCLAAGMDGYHPKPIEFPELLNLLEQWLKP